MAESRAKANSGLMINLIFGVAGIALGAFGTFAFTGMGKGGGDPVVAKFNGRSIKGSEVFGNIKTHLYQQEEQMFRMKEQAINEYVDRQLLEQEAKKKNVSIEQLLDQETGGPVAAVTDAEVKAFLEARKIKPNDPNIRMEQVKEFLNYQKKFEKRQGYVQKLRAGANVAILIAEPESPRIIASTDGYPTWGEASAKVTIVEFSDFQCPYCARAVPILEQIKQEYGPKRVRIVFRDMPIPGHQNANAASLAAHCANEQGKFWEYHNALFKNQAHLEDADLNKYATELGMDGGKFKECFTKKRHQATIDRSKTEAQSLGIGATPSFVINGTLIEGALPFERFKEKIDRAEKGRS